MEEFRLKWQTHVPILCQEFGELLTHEQHVDVTLACHNGKVKAHRLILSSSSPLLETVLASNLSPDATIILPDIDVAVLRTLVDYIYRGEIAVQDTELQSLVTAATLLQIRGIALASPQSQNELNASIQSTMPIGTSAVQNLTNQLSSPLSTSPVRALMARKFVRTKRKMAASDKPVSPHKKQLLLNSQERHLFSDSGKKENHDLVKGDADVADTNVANSPDCETETLKATNLQSDKVSTVKVPSDTSKSKASENQEESNHAADESVTEDVPGISCENKINGSCIEDLSIGQTRPVKTESNTNEMANSSDKMTANHGPSSKLENGVSMVDLTACVFCKKHFTCSEQLREHISSVHVSDRLEKQFKCDFCPAAFARSAHLKRHVRTHTGEKPYACTLCPRAFSRQDKLKCHMDRHCEGNTRNPRQRNHNNNNINNNDLNMGDFVSLGLSSNLLSQQASSIDNHSLLQSADSDHSLLRQQQQNIVPVSTNPSLPYLQHILDDVQIVRDKKPASYYRQMKRQILAGSTGGVTGGTVAAAADGVPEHLLKAVRQLGECTIKLAAAPVIE